MPPPPPGFRGQFLTDLPSRAAYSEGAGPYRIVPRVVAVPADLEDLVRLVRHAVEIGEPLTPRGAGSGIPGNNIGRGIVVDLRELRQPVSVSPQGVANLGAAVSWEALDRMAAPQGLRLAPNPSSGAACTIGGMVATNAAGARSVRAGSIRRWVRGLEMVTADGEVGWFGRAAVRRERRTVGAEAGARSFITSDLAARDRFERDAKPALLAARAAIAARFPATRKNSSGYALDRYLESGDLVDLLIGSEGTLGIVTRVELALEPVPGATATALVALDGAQGLAEVVERLLRLEPGAVELLDRSFLDLAAPRLPFPLEGVELVLLVDFEREDSAAARAAVEATRERLANQVSWIDTAVSPRDRERLWAVRHAASPALAALPASRRSLQIVEDGCVPVAALGRYLTGVRDAAGEAGIEIVAFGHAGDGHLHVNSLADLAQPDFEARLSRLWDMVTALVIELGGTPSGEHGDGRLRAPLLERVYGAEVMELFTRVKRAFDPAGILNPGVILPAPGAGATADLKVGRDAAPIPAGIEAALREIERAGAWATPKTELTGRPAA